MCDKYPWKLVKLSDFISSLEAGVSVNSEDIPAKEDEYGILKTSAVNNGIFRSQENKRILESELIRAKLNPEEGSVIISRMNTPDLVGEVAYIDKNYMNLFLPDRLWQTKYSKPTSGKWLIYMLSLSKYKQKIKGMATGTSNSMKNISKESLMSLEIPYPEYEEQKQIALIISTWDEAIQLKQELIEQKKQLKKGLINKFLTGSIRLPGYSKNWVEVRLRTLFDRVTRKNTEENSNVLTISAQNGLISQEDFFSKLVASESLENYFLLEKGEFAYNKSYSRGYPMGAIKRLTMYDKGVVTTLYICFKLKEKLNFSPEFFEQYFEAGLLNRGLTRVANEGGRAHGLLNVTPSDFFNLKVKVPDGEEQKAIADILVNADKEIQLLEKELDLLKQQKKGLMQLLLSGKVRVNC